MIKWAAILFLLVVNAALIVAAAKTVGEQMVARQLAEKQAELDRYAARSEIALNER